MLSLHEAVDAFLSDPRTRGRLKPSTLQVYRKDLAAAAPIYTPLFCSNRGTRLSYDALPYQWAQACASAGLADDNGDLHTLAPILREDRTWSFEKPQLYVVSEAGVFALGGHSNEHVASAGELPVLAGRRAGAARHGHPVPGRLRRGLPARRHLGRDARHVSWTRRSKPMSDQPTNTDVWMLHPDLEAIAHTALPTGYRMRFYAEGDLDTWLRTQAHDPFFVPTAETFAASMPGDTPLLAARVMFLVDPAGAAVGTVTAWINDRLTGREIGQIHWVALVPAAQGQGLAKPMVGAACALLHERGYREACLETNTRRLPALNLYLALGFVPFVRSEAERRAWRAVAPQLRLPVHIPG